VESTGVNTKSLVVRLDVVLLLALTVALFVRVGPVGATVPHPRMFLESLTPRPVDTGSAKPDIPSHASTIGLGLGLHQRELDSVR